MTQKERLRHYLLANGSITPMQAWNTLGIYRLGARIHELREEGMEITTETAEVCNRFGETCKVARYCLTTD